MHCVWENCWDQGISEEKCDSCKTCQLHVAGITKLQTAVQSQTKWWFYLDLWAISDKDVGSCNNLHGALPVFLPAVVATSAVNPLYIKIIYSDHSFTQMSQSNHLCTGREMWEREDMAHSKIRKVDTENRMLNGVNGLMCEEWSRHWDCDNNQINWNSNWQQT